MDNNYSKINGVMTRKIKNNDITIRKEKLERCPKCEDMIEERYTYCKSCGFNLETVSIKYKKESVAEKFGYKSIINYLNMPKTLYTSLTATIILLIVSILGKDIVSNYISNIGNLINPIHILLGLNLGSLNVYSSSMMGWSGTELKFGLIILAILPILSITISNLIFNKKYTKNSEHAFRNSLGVGISYGIILGILALFSKTRVSYSYNMMQYGYMARLSFSVLGMIVKGFILGFISSYMVLYKKKYEDENMYLGIFKSAINVLIIGYLTTFVILLILTITDKSYLYNLGISTNMGSLNTFIMISQLAAYIWTFGNFIPITIGSKEISIVNLMGSELYLTTILMLTAMFFLSILALIVASCKLESKYGRENGIKPVLILSVFYALLVGALSIITTLTLGGGVDILNFSNYSTSLNMGFGLLSSIIITFIYSFIVSLVGYKLNIFN